MTKLSHLGVLFSLSSIVILVISLVLVANKYIPTLPRA
jgi:hypothetical protein